MASSTARPTYTVEQFRQTCGDRVLAAFRDACTMGPDNWLHYRIAESHQEALRDALMRAYEILRDAPVVDLRAAQAAKADASLQRFLEAVAGRGHGPEGW